MTTVDQFLKALAEVESSDNPEAWGDGGRAMGRWQVHPDRLWTEMHAMRSAPQLGETWDQLVARALRWIFTTFLGKSSPLEMAMYWHLGHWSEPADPKWDARYAAKFEAALAVAREQMP